MKKCPFCSEPVQDDAKYCPHCTQPIWVHEHMRRTDAVFGWGIAIGAVALIVFFALLLIFN